MKKKAIVLFLTFIMVLSSTAISARAYIYYDPKHCINEMITFIPHSGFGATTISHMNEALYQWNKAVGKSIVSRSPTERHSKTGYPSKDGKSLIYREKFPESKGYAVAETSTYTKWFSDFKKSETVSESDIGINMSHKFANSGIAGYYDVWTIFLHESGHTVGLKDVDDPSVVMYKEAETQILRRTLQPDDIRGAVCLYQYYAE